MGKWLIKVRPRRVGLAGATLPDECACFYRDGELVAIVYPTEHGERGLQITSERLDFEAGMLGLPDGDGGQIVYRVKIVATETVASATAYGRWLALRLREGA